MFVTDVGGAMEDGGIPVVGWNRYIARAADLDIVENSTTSIVYAKLARFMFWGELTPIPEGQFTNTRIDPHGGAFTTEGCVLGPLFGEFLFDRARHVFSHFDQALSEAQREVIDQEVKASLPKFLESDMAATLLADFGSPISPVTGRRIGRNEPCPCRSGKKYKRCHGAPM